MLKYRYSYVEIFFMKKRVLALIFLIYRVVVPVPKRMIQIWH